MRTLAQGRCHQVLSIIVLSLWIIVLIGGVRVSIVFEGPVNDHSFIRAGHDFIASFLNCFIHEFILHITHLDEVPTVAELQRKPEIDGGLCNEVRGVLAIGQTAIAKMGFFAPITFVL